MLLTMRNIPLEAMPLLETRILLLPLGMMFLYPHAMLAVKILLTPVSTVYLPLRKRILNQKNYVVDGKFKSKRLNALHEAGKMKNLTTAVGKASLSQRNRKSSKGNKAEPLHRIVKIVPFQQVEEGVFIQQVRVKTIKVGIIIFCWFSSNTKPRF